MESKPQNPEFRKNPEAFHPCSCRCDMHQNHLVCWPIFLMLGSRYEGVFLKASVFSTKILIVGTEKNQPR